MREVRGDWRDLFNCFRMALDLRKLSLGLVGMALSGLWIFLVLAGGLFAYERSTQEGAHPLMQALSEGRLDLVHERIHAFAGAVFPAPRRNLEDRRAEARLQAETRRLENEESGVSCPAGCDEGCCPIANCPVLGRIASRIGMPTPLGALIYGLCGFSLLAIWSFFGGAITRIAAVELARDERIELGEATRFANARYGSYLWSPLSVIVAALVFALCIMGMAWVCDATWSWGLGKLLLIVGLPLALLGGGLILLLAIGGILGLGLMFPAVSAEGTDAFDAVSRAFSYVFSRPWRFLWYHAVAIAYAIPSCLFVGWFTCTFLNLTLKLGARGMPHAAEPGHFGAVLSALAPGLGGHLAPVAFSDGALLWFTTCLVSAMLYLVVGLAWAYPVSYCFSARTIIYFLMRKAVDGTEMKEVYEEESEEDLVAGGAPAGTPPAPSAPPA